MCLKIISSNIVRILRCLKKEKEKERERERERERVVIFEYLKENINIEQHTKKLLVYSIL